MYLKICFLNFCVIFVFTNADTDSALALKIHKMFRNTTDRTTISYHEPNKHLVWKLNPASHFAYRYQENKGIYRGLQYHPRSSWARLAKLIPFVKEAQNMDRDKYDNIDKGLKIDKRHRPIFLVTLRKNPSVHRVQNHIEEVFDVPGEIHEELQSSLLNLGVS